jgi:hypothetical protein
MEAADPSESFTLTVDEGGYVTYKYTSSRKRSKLVEPSGEMAAVKGVFKDRDGQNYIQVVDADGDEDDDHFLLVDPSTNRYGEVEGEALYLPGQSVKVSTELATAVKAYLNGQKAGDPVTQSVKFAYPDFKPEILEAKEGGKRRGSRRTTKGGKRRGSRRMKARVTRRGRRSM